MVSTINIIANACTCLSYVVLTFQIFQLSYQTRIHTARGRYGNNLSNIATVIAILFGSFILLCGAVHGVHSIKDSFGANAISTTAETILLCLCGFVSVLTAIVTFKLFPAIQDLLSKLELNDHGQLQHLETYLTETVNLFQESVAILSSDMKILRGNSATACFYGASYNGVVVDNHIHPEDLMQFHDAFSKSINNYSEPMISVEYRVHTAVGKRYTWVESCLQRRFSSDRYSNFEVNMMTRDISSRKLLEHARVEESKNATKLNYIACVAHDLKTPLHSFAMTTELLSKTKLDSEQTELLKSSTVAVDLMRLTIAQAMDINKAISGMSLTPRRTTVCISSIINKVSTILEWYTKQVEIKYRIYSDVYDYIITDEEWLWQILLNYLTNACKYTQEGGIEVVVKVDQESSGHCEMLMFEVRDSGVGINPTKMDSLFSAFGQVQEGASTGTGLGLFGLKSRVTGLGGKCGVYTNDQSVTGSGSVFWFTIPYKKDLSYLQESYDCETWKDIPKEPEELLSRKSTMSSVTTETTLDGMAFLDASGAVDIVNIDGEAMEGLHTAFVVDDVLSIRKLMSKLLLKVGFKEVECFENGWKALNALKTKQVDAVFSDIQMPVMTGPEMVERFRNFEREELSSGRRKERQLIIAVSANSNAVGSDIAEDAVNHFDYILGKPLGIADVKRILLQRLHQSNVADLFVTSVEV